MARHAPQAFAPLASLTPGSWINANFNVWIGAPEDNRSWDYLAAARETYDQFSNRIPPDQKARALEQLLICEGSDWNWWYGPEHHSPNDRDFDELYRTHLSNVYHALASTPPGYLAQPIGAPPARPFVCGQSGYIHPRIDGEVVSYFEWLGAASYTADRRQAAMHGREFLLDMAYCGIDETNLYGRIDLAPGKPLEKEHDLVANIECVSPGQQEPCCRVRLEATVKDENLLRWRIGPEGVPATPPADSACQSNAGVLVAFRRILEFQIALGYLFGATPPNGARVRLRFSIWRDQLPLDALPTSSALELRVLPEQELRASA